MLAYLQHPRLRSALSIVSALVIVASTFVLTALPTETRASNTNVLGNGDFEGGFASQAGCGMVGAGWSCFTNGGAATFGFYDEQWSRVVASGLHSQLIEINGKGMMQPDHDRYAGIYQTVAVADWEEYELRLSGWIRTTVHDGDPWRYRVQVGWTAGKQADWTKVSNWTDVGWDTYYDRLNPGGPSSFRTKLKAESDYLTVYIRVWRKWGVPEEEIDVNLDAIALNGPSPYRHGHHGKVVVEPVGPTYTAPVVIPPAHGDAPVVIPPAQAAPPVVIPPAQAAPPVVIPPAGCTVELVYNGGFEQGFNPVADGHVGKGWGYFTNGGAANYGFYDEQWPPVVAEGAHGQLIEINTKGRMPADANRYAGIYQRISNLKPGQSYDLTVRGLLRGVGGEEDPYRFEAQWGYHSGHNSDWTTVNNWTAIDLGKIYPRLEPGPLGIYKVSFTAPSSEITLFLRTWMKWGVSEVELDFNLDAISLRGCTAPSKPAEPTCRYDYSCDGYKPAPPVVERPHRPHHGSCSYMVKPGDILGFIAEDYGVSLWDLQSANDIMSPDLIYVGQKLVIPGCSGAVSDSYGAESYGADAYVPATYVSEASVIPYGETKRHYVAAGETLSGICSYYGIEPQVLAEANGISNIDFIYVGQELVIP